MKYLAILLVFVSAAMAQNAVIPVLPFSFTASAIDLPGGIKSFVGTDAGFTFQPNEYVQFADHNYISTDTRLKYFGAGADYFFPAFSLKVNNMTPKMSGFRLLLSLGGSLGNSRVTNGSIVQSHWGEEFHGALSYAVTSDGGWQLGIRAGAARFPYYASSAWTPVISLGGGLHF